MTRELIGAIAISLVALIAALIFFSNRSLRRAQESSLPEPHTGSAVEDAIAGFYVSTVFADAPLKRVWAYGLGGRGKALLGVTANGVTIERQGERNLLIAADQLVGVTRASATIDKGVERDGLLVLIWQLGDEELATHLRIVAKSERRNFEEKLTEVLGVEIG